MTEQSPAVYLSHRWYGAKKAQAMMGLKFRGGGIPGVEQFAEAVDREHLVAIRLTPAG